MTTPQVHDEPLSPEELAAHRAAAASGKIPSLEICRRFVLNIRKNWLAKPEEKTKGKSRTVKAKPDENLEFF